MKKFNTYRRKLLCRNGSIYDGRWSTSKKIYMEAASQYAYDVVALGPWEKQSMGGDDWELAIDLVEDSEEED